MNFSFVRRTVTATFFAATLGTAILMPAHPAWAAEVTVSLSDPARDLTAWRPPTGDWKVASSVALDPADPTRFTISPGQGVLVNGTQGKTVALITQAEFGDVEVHVEFCIPKHSNSGIYLMGRYEVQIYDSYGVLKDKYPGIECGGIYERWENGKGFGGFAPRSNASRSLGQWQYFHTWFRAPRFNAAGTKTANARFLWVKHNGHLIHTNVEVTGPTRAAQWETEAATGPLLIQGDHGPVAYRNIYIRALRPPGR